MTNSATIVSELRTQFPALRKQVNGKEAVYFDGPAGTQVPQCVIDAIGDYLSTCNANHEGRFPTSIESDQLLHEVHQAYADFLGADDPNCVFFGQNMTSLTFAMSRAIANSWQPGDEIIVTNLDHDANVSPWILAARDAGVSVFQVDIRKDDCTLDVEQLMSRLSDRTRLVAVGCASNSVGTVNPVREICAAARSVGALSFLDAVHWAPHRRTNVAELGCDFLACSSYKFFGPHVGIMWGRRELLESMIAYKVRPASNELPGKWMTGTQSHESLAGAKAAVDYLADVGRKIAEQSTLDRSAALDTAFRWIGDYEMQLFWRLVEGLQQIPQVKIFGITDPRRTEERLPTLSITHETRTPSELATRLGEKGIFAWHGNYYALCLSEALGMEPDGMLRIGLAHYNTAEEVERLLAELRDSS